MHNPRNYHKGNPFTCMRTPRSRSRKRSKAPLYPFSITSPSSSPKVTTVLIPNTIREFCLSVRFSLRTAGSAGPRTGFADRQEWESCFLGFLAVWPWANYLTSLNADVLICKRRSTWYWLHRARVRTKWENRCQVSGAYCTQECWLPSAHHSLFSWTGWRQERLGLTLAPHRRSLKAGEKNPKPPSGRPDSRKDLLVSEQIPVRKACAVPSSVAWRTCQIKIGEEKGMLVPWEGGQMPLTSPSFQEWNLNQKRSSGQNPFPRLPWNMYFMQGLQGSNDPFSWLSGSFLWNSYVPKEELSARGKFNKCGLSKLRALS